MRLGFMWNCPWRIEWKKPFEYWDRYQLGSFFLLHYRQRSYDYD